MTTTPRRTPWVLLLILSGLWLGFLAGMALGGGIAASARALTGLATVACGAAGALVSALLCGFLSKRVPTDALRACALIALLFSLATGAHLAYRLHQLALAHPAPARTPET